jgi:ABC-type uncharacterized transport system substrate-binding protein
MRRRDFLTLIGGAAAVCPLAARAQQSRTARIGALYIGTPDAESFKKELRGGLRELGYVEGQNIVFEFRAAEGMLDRLPELAAELVALKVDVIVALYTPCPLAAQRATREIPIVVLAGDPVRLGLVASLARPGANITGISLMAVELHGKCVELFRDELPGTRRIAALGNAPDPFSNPMLEQIRVAGRNSGIEIVPEIMVRSPDEIDAAFAGMKKDGAEGVIAQASLPARHVVVNDRRAAGGCSGKLLSPARRRACIRRVAGCATPTGSAGHAGATANLKLTFQLDHSAGADQRRPPGAGL